MDFKQVFLYDGTPYLAFRNEDGEYDYPEEVWTEVTPPEGIYSPFYFNGNDWVGSTKEEYEKSLSKGEKTQPSTSEIMMSSTQMQVAESSFQLRETQQKLAETMMDNTEKDKRLESLEQQQAQLLLELVEIKGGE